MALKSGPFVDLTIASEETLRHLSSKPMWCWLNKWVVSNFSYQRGYYIWTRLYRYCLDNYHAS